MTILQDIINLLYLILLPTTFFVGYKIGQKSGHTYLLGNDKPLEHFDSIGGMKRTEYEIKEDNINHEGVGIIYRPSVEEIEKMNEPKQEREAKEAVAETIRNTPTPEI